MIRLPHNGEEAARVGQTKPFLGLAALDEAGNIVPAKIVFADKWWRLERDERAREKFK